MRFPEFNAFSGIKLALLKLRNLLPFAVSKRLPLSRMVNEERVRSSIKRIFKNSVAEVLGEVFQNSQRAGATRVAIKTTGSGFTIEDNGTGVDGITGFHALLKIADSRYEEPTVETDQKPMGLGLHSLLSFDQVTHVIFASQNLELEIDCARWFTDERYYATWFKRLKSRREKIAGLRITVVCSSKMTEKLKEALKPQDTYLEWSPAQGYEGLLQIDLNGAPVETGLPRWARMTRILIETAYQGSRLRIGLTDGYSSKNSIVRWYGQIIPFEFSNFFTLCLDVTHGHPVEPRAPTRAGLIKNESYAKLLAFAKDELFRFLFAPENRDRIEASWVRGYYDLDSERALKEAPYYVASPRRPLKMPDSYEDLKALGNPEIFSYAEIPQPRLLNGTVMLQLDGSDRELDYGLDSFLPLVGPAYRLDRGDRRRLAIEQLYWRPGKLQRLFFYEPGEYGLSRTGEEPQAFAPVTLDEVFVFEQTAPWDVEGAEFTAAATDHVNFLNDLSWAAFDPNDSDASYDELHDSYEESIKILVRQIIGNCIDPRFSIYDLTPFFEEKDSRVETIRVVYQEESRVPQQLLVTNSAGETVNLSLLS